MSSEVSMVAVNRTRGLRLASSVRVARTHWTRLRGLIGTSPSEFQPGSALWIVPCRGVHTFAMRFPLDLLYLDSRGCVVGVFENIRPWRVAPMRMKAASVLELPSGAIAHSATQSGDRIEMLAMHTTDGDAA